MDSSAMDYTMHNPHHHHHHHHHHHSSGGASSSSSAARCPALRAASEQRNYQLPTISPVRGPVHYDPVHANAAANRNAWQSRSPQNWRPAMISSPFGQQDPFLMGTYPGQTPPNQPAQPPTHCPMPNISNIPNVPEAYPPQIPSFQHFRPAMHPVPRLLGQPSYHSSGGYAGSNPSQSSSQYPSNRPVHRANAGFPNSSSMHSANTPGQVPVSGPSAPTMQMGQTTSFANENDGPSQQLPNVLPQIFTNQDNQTSFSQQTPESTAQNSAASEEVSFRPASDSPSVPASTAPQRTNDQYGRMTNPVEIRRASTAAMGRSRRSVSRFNAPSEWLGENANAVLFRRDMGLMEFVESFPGAVSDGEGLISGQRFLRGNVSGKRVASRKALASLQSVNIADLSESERSKFLLAYSLA
ncbi:hypothetical protein HD806DRAFT_519067 [Xylariaceae sp. AK1471]|nr:hypothetical protein HD806DRAFT_519067 [Xylariaceae sp. AK1471]